jgi:hypothetical protein
MRSARATRLDLLVKEAEVKTFTAQVTMKGYGTCRFNLNDFDQVEKLPQALLKAQERSSDCSVRMWEQGPKVTIAFNSCAEILRTGCFQLPLADHGRGEIRALFLNG